MTIQCQEPAEAEAYKIFKEGGLEPQEAKTSTLDIKEMKPDQTGLYHCSYRSGELWSPRSSPLTVVLTGAYEKPSLSSMSGTVVASGDKVTLKCFLKFKFDRFILIKEDEFHTIQNQSATCQDSQCQAIFNRGPVNATQAGTYRCYGAFNNDPYVWSHPSDPLELEVKELPDGSTRPTDLGPTQEFPDVSTRPKDLRPTQEAAKAARQPVESRNRQAPEARDPQDVTYLQVVFNGPNQGTFSTPRQTHTSEYATVVPR
ncbi:leukocyte immunoglobulin-like receptor subfamily A member 6 isoform X2 [Artibeus jamaicensis]|uniref:leukocyte immunoglobulin-like receptor subfamily A member 6 isoform X2 n=1 Tax=Artibeus jamaicensis TaxID=9417 RepID=UPI00235AAB48|nr:leukocyte immunoglobulin-like receptor subfamily A member 6 isoform X2 [Artibeus jamaicensis]